MVTIKYWKDNTFDILEDLRQLFCLIFERVQRTLKNIL